MLKRYVLALSLKVKSEISNKPNFQCRFFGAVSTLHTLFSLHFIGGIYEMKKEQQEGIFVVAENTHHYNGAPSGNLYTFMKGRGLWIKDPLDIAFFQGKVERGSGFHIEKSAINIADKVKVVKKEATASITEKLKKKLPGKKKPTTDKKAAEIKAESKEKMKKALEVLDKLDKKEAEAAAKATEPIEVAAAEPEKEVEK